MTQRDWDKELAKIDKQLASLPDEELLPPAPSGTGMPRGASAPAQRSVASAPAASSPAVSGKARAWAWTKLTVALVAGVGIWLWPWPARCGMPLAGLMAAGGGVALLGLWSAMGTWRHRLGRAHVLSLLIVVSGVVLVAREVLPRVGYAHSTFDRPERWTCQTAPPTAPAAPTSETPGTIRGALRPGLR